MEERGGLRHSGLEFARRVGHRWYILLLGVVGGVVWVADLAGLDLKLPPSVSWAAVAVSFLLAIFWAFHDLRTERDERISELEANPALPASGSFDDRYSALSDLLGESLYVGRDISLNRRGWILLGAWEAHTRDLVSAAYGDGQAAHVFTPQLGEAKVYRGLDMIKAPPPSAEIINNVRVLIGRMNTLAIRSGFDPSDWVAFDPDAYQADHAHAAGRGRDEWHWKCPWCEREVGPYDDCGCGAEKDGDLVYRKSPASVGSAV